MYIIEDREAGWEIDRVETIEDARELLRLLELDDKREGIFEENFYCIRDTRTDEIL